MEPHHGGHAARDGSGHHHLLPRAEGVHRGGDIDGGEGLILAIDGGNSKTDVALVAADGRVLATARGGPFTPHTDGVPAAVATVLHTVRRAGITTSPALVAAFLAGADLPAEEEILAAEFALQGFSGRIVVRNDTFALLRAGASGPWGVAVVCGAGINAVGVSPTGRMARFPALGKMSGDWGGGQDVAEEMLWHAVRAEDGRGPATSLSTLVRRQFAVGSVEELVLDLHFGRIDPARVLELAPGLFTAAGSGDAVAASLVRRLAEEVVVMAEVCLRRLDLLETPTEVVLGGGMLTARDPLMTALLDGEFAGRAPRAKLLVADVPPIAGAALSGLDLLGATEEAKALLRAQYTPRLP
ncbi:N-acetylglucosamine kinase [Nonomuraea sp. NPDC059023]|uniref:N-acetylglucosamine kinase n=1 Tax=unclassified Nonomuraea TaxID=2593643 RepID=UPI0036C90F0C